MKYKNVNKINKYLALEVVDDFSVEVMAVVMKHVLLSYHKHLMNLQISFQMFVISK
jgi:hypothetical protein